MSLSAHFHGCTPGNYNGLIFNEIKCVSLAGQRIEPDVVHCEYFQAVFIQEVELLEAIQVIVGFLNAGMYLVVDAIIS